VHHHQELPAQIHPALHPDVSLLPNFKRIEYPCRCQILGSQLACLRELLWMH
jgi:hypothetical protein